MSIMQTSKRILVLNLSSFQRISLRNVAVNNVSGNVEEGAQLKSWKDIPGPPSLPIIGQLHNFLPGGRLSDLRTFQDDMYKMFGPIARFDATLGRQPMLFLFDPETCAHVLRSENMNPIRPGFASLEYYRKKHNKTEEQSKLPTGLISECDVMSTNPTNPGVIEVVEQQKISAYETKEKHHGDNWSYFRKTVNPVMLQPKTIRLYSSLVDEVAQDMIMRMKSNRDENSMIIGDFNTEMNLWSLESIGVVALGGRLNCFDPNLAEDSPEKRLIKCVHEIFIISNELDFKPSLWRYFSTKKFKKGMKLYEEQETLAKYFIDKARKQMVHKEKTDDEKGILEKLLEIDERVAIIMACDMLFAGVDTAATTVMGALYLLAANQDKQDKLRREITSGEDSKKYLRACIKESLRVLPVVGGNMRLSTKEYNLHGYRIPKDVFIIFCHQYLSRMESQYPQPDEFIPERWFEEGPLSHKSAHPFAYSPFGFGTRMCIGRRIAELEIETFLSRVIQNFKVEWFGPPPDIEPGSLNYIKGPFNFIFKDV